MIVVSISTQCLVGEGIKLTTRIQIPSPLLLPNIRRVIYRIGRGDGPGRLRNANVLPNRHHPHSRGRQGPGVGGPEVELAAFIAAILGPACELDLLGVDTSVCDYIPSSIFSGA